MEEVSVKIDSISLDKTATVVVDVESLQQPTDRSSGSPKIMRALSRKWSYRTERLTSAEDEDTDEYPKKSLLKGNSQMEPLKQSIQSNNKSLSLTSANHGGSNNVIEASEGGRNKKLNRFLTVNPRKILCIFATASSVGSLLLIYFTLAINGTF